MKNETRDALALELTKAKMTKVAHLQNSRIDVTSAYDWVKMHLESEKEIDEAHKKIKPPVKFKSIPFGF